MRKYIVSIAEYLNEGVLFKEYKNHDELTIQLLDGLTEETVSQYKGYNRLVSFLSKSKSKNAVISVSIDDDSPNMLYIVWVKGTFLNGLMDFDEWSDGIFKSGVLDSVKWIKGSFESGVAKSVKWINGTWKGGQWYDGDWFNGYWYDGVFYSGKWYNGNWYNGDFKSTAVWIKGYAPNPSNDNLVMTSNAPSK